WHWQQSLEKKAKRGDPGGSINAVHRQEHHERNEANRAGKEWSEFDPKEALSSVIHRSLHSGQRGEDHADELNAREVNGKSFTGLRKSRHRNRNPVRREEIEQ